MDQWVSGSTEAYPLLISQLLFVVGHKHHLRKTEAWSSSPLHHILSRSIRTPFVEVAVVASTRCKLLVRSFTAAVKVDPTSFTMLFNIILVHM